MTLNEPKEFWRGKMRMWNLDPSRLCRKHLLGEHLEMHMFVGAINKGKPIRGYIDKGLVEVHNIKRRHEELSKEMGRRGYRHNSPLPEFVDYVAGVVDIERNKRELMDRCEDCFYWK